MGNQKEVYSWGFGENFVLGNRDDCNEFEPKILHPKMFEENPVVMMACGTMHAVALALESPEAKMPELSLPVVQAIPTTQVQREAHDNAQESKQMVGSQPNMNGTPSKKRGIEEISSQVPVNGVQTEESAKRLKVEAAEADPKPVEGDQTNAAQPENAGE